jgi:hypothetical protein
MFISYKDLVRHVSGDMIKQNLRIGDVDFRIKPLMIE